MIGVFRKQLVSFWTLCCLTKLKVAQGTRNDGLEDVLLLEMLETDEPPSANFFRARLKSYVTSYSGYIHDRNMLSFFQTHDLTPESY